MRMTAALLALLLAAPAQGAPEQEDAFADTHLSWRQLGDLGGLALGVPYRDRSEKWILAVDCNVAGARAVSQAPSRRAPDQGVRRVSAEIQGERIYIWVLSAEPRQGPPDPECRGAFLGYPHAGSYQVFYREPRGEQRPIGTALVPEYRLGIPGRPRR